MACLLCMAVVHHAFFFVVGNIPFLSDTRAGVEVLASSHTHNHPLDSSHYRNQYKSVVQQIAKALLGTILCRPDLGLFLALASCRRLF